MSHLPWQIGLLLLCLLIFCIDAVVGAIQNRHDRKTFISNRELNAHRVTPRFHVGSDVK